MIEVLDGAAARRWVGAAVEGLAAARERIDALNVYPVPDGDTGTNLHLTLRQAQRDLHLLDAAASLAEISDVVARGALMGARGNSGIITSQLLRGWADELARPGPADAARVRSALSRADEQAWGAVEDPVEGTMLSVTRAAAVAAGDAGPSLADVVQAAVAGARTALAATTEQLTTLRDAGVVDAGGCGIVVLLEALAAVVTGRDPVGLSGDLTRPPAEPLALAAGEGCPDAEPSGPAFEVMFLIDGADDGVPALRSRLAGLGDSLVVVGGAGLWHVHVHTDEPGAAVEAGIEAGRPHQLRITHFATMAAAVAAGTAGTPETTGTAQAAGTAGAAGTAERAGATGSGSPVGEPRDAVGVVAWAAGPGLAETFRASGVVPVTDAAGRRASTGEVLAAVRDAGTRAVVVLPNDPDTLAVATAAARAARAEGLRVTVVPTRAQVQGLAAAAVHDAGADLEDDVVAMTSAAGATRHGAVTVAARDAITMAGRCSVGDVLGVVDGDFAVIGSDLAVVAAEVLSRLLSGGGELVTLVTGQGAPDGLADELAHAVRAQRREVEVVVLDGGQPRYPLLVGVE